MFVLFTDFGTGSPYVGQLHAVLHAQAPGRAIVDLCHDAPQFSPRPAAYLLAALAAHIPAGSIIIAVVDPGVGTERAGLIAQADGRWFTGPDNGLLAPALAQDPGARAWRIRWRPENLSATFHGRDLFAPVAARLAERLAAAETLEAAMAELAAAEFADEQPVAEIVGAGWPADLGEIIYIDAFGNCATGTRASAIQPGTRLAAGGHELAPARTFGDLPAGAPFWYENANGLAEIAVNQGSARDTLNLAVGDPVNVLFKIR